MSKEPLSPTSLTTIEDEKKTLVDHGKRYSNTTINTTTTSLERSPPPAYHSSSFHHSLSSRARYSQYIQPITSVHFYQPTPPPQTVIVHDTPSRSKDACCWGCVAGLILCFGAKECLCF
ncbi:uncharacterized protein BX664DRAFT_332477 [Halteromyces radiatus]|uniref:uncharacterized protein n=1 Tax=Halteromyces radiatus TaxID=101107 RepID=UPI00221F602F|nr:uncharacterized protein BX664DRAFT_332477 [Halteromyces radiatus]KAI8089226.1 hypothetical protein BX664DRAFT_332477 [Halteromyces radiatus]